VSKIGSAGSVRAFNSALSVTNVVGLTEVDQLDSFIYFLLHKFLFHGFHKFIVFNKMCSSIVINLTVINNKINFKSKLDDDDVSEESESEEKPQPVKIRKVEKEKPVSGRRSKRAQESEESADSDDEVLAKNKKVNRRASNKQSRKNTPEPEENRSSRRSSKKFVEESPAERRASKRSLDAFNAISLSALIDEVIKHKQSWPFLKPVTATEVPDYFDVIKKPMDFGKIKSKLNLGDYRTNEQVMKDVELVFYNCDLYNVASTEIYE
jgi:bromodomain adjacent to zinc finger domain protein 1A